jgi:DNA-binding beta-propeller fold protein YncE
VPYAEDPLDDTTPTEVQVTPDGRYALLRLSGKALLRSVELPSGKIIDLPLGAEPTDLDLNAAGDLAIVVLREANTLAFVEVPEAFADPLRVEAVTSEHPFGQATVSADGARAFLFTNATNEEVLLVADLQTRELSPVRMQKGIRAVRVAPDGKTALVLHNKLPDAPQTGDDADTLIDKQEGYTLLSVAARFPTKLQITETAVGQTAFAPDSEHGYLLLSDQQADIRLLEAIDLRSFLVDRVELGSPPAGIGVLPATEQIYVAQNHPLGRVTFVDSKTHKTRTLTGFALNSQVIE